MTTPEERLAKEQLAEVLERLRRSILNNMYGPDEPDPYYVVDDIEAMLRDFKINYKE